MSELLWGVDLGGTKIECAVLKSKNDPKILFRERLPTEGSKGYAHVLSQIEKLLTMASSIVEQKPKQLGFGSPGTIDRTNGLLRGSNSQHLNHKPLVADLSALFNVPIRIENDANCFTLAETRMGAVTILQPEVKTVLGVILGTGIGGSIVVNGSLLNGPNQITGEWGHNFLHKSGGRCYCGKTGCVETIISGPALEKYYTSHSGKVLALPDIISQAQCGDPHAIDTQNRLLRFFGRGLAAVINILDPDAIVLGGGVGNIDLLYDKGKSEIQKYLFSPVLNTKILKPKLGDSAGVFGAAYLWSR